MVPRFIVETVEMDAKRVGLKSSTKAEATDMNLLEQMSWKNSKEAMTLEMNHTLQIDNGASSSSSAVQLVLHHPKLVVGL